MKKIRVAVVGVGQMGENHVKAYQQRSDVDFLGVIDVDSTRARDIARKYDCRALSMEDLPNNIDAASIVTSSHTHHKIGAHLLSKKIHCLVEKPLAMTLEQSKQLVSIAKENRVVLLVGHLEEYNTGFQYIRSHLERIGEIPRSISASRFNYGSDRIKDVDVVLDLMIHDLGCVVDLMGPDVRYLEVLHAAGMGTATSVDTAVATLKARECIITLQANRICHQRNREFILHTKSFSYFLNFISQQVSVFHKNQLSTQTSHPWKSPLEHEIEHFIECIRDDQKTPITSGAKAAVTIKYIEDIQKKIYQPLND